MPYKLLLACIDIHRLPFDARRGVGRFVSTVLCLLGRPDANRDEQDRTPIPAAHGYPASVYRSSQKRQRHRQCFLQLGHHGTALALADTLSPDLLIPVAADLQPVASDLQSDAHYYKGMISMMSLHYVQKGVLTKEDGKLIKRIFDLRQESDYDDFIDADEDDIKSYLPLVTNLVNTIVLLIK